jgi:hypothetical protein
MLNEKSTLAFRWNHVFRFMLCVLFISAGLSAAASGQVAPAAARGISSLSAGVTITAFRPYPNAETTLPGYSDRVLLGAGAFVDFNVSKCWGIEAEGHWLRFHEFAQVHEDTYLIGPRMLVPKGRFRFYGKALYGFGRFAFPYGYATEQDPVLAFGGGVDYRLTRRISVRLLDGEYQRWRNFQDKGLSPYGASAGVAYRIF